MSDKISFQGKVLNGGRFISRGKGRHSVRRIDSDELIYVVSGELAIYEERNDFMLRPGEWSVTMMPPIFADVSSGIMR